MTFYFNKNTKEITTNPPWGSNYIDDEIIKEKYSDWEKYDSFKDIQETQQFLELKKKELIYKIKDTRNNIESSDIKYNGKFYQLDYLSVQRMIFMIDYMKTKSIDNIDWKSSNNEENTLTKDELNNIIVSAAERTSKLHLYYNKLKEEINNSSSMSDLSKIDIEFSHYNE